MPDFWYGRRRNRSAYRHDHDHPDRPDAGHQPQDRRRHRCDRHLATELDRYLLDSRETGGAIAVVEHNLAPRVLAAPVHRHSREDEYSLVLEGRLGVFQDDEVVVAEAGELVLKPRGRWHTFWNAGDQPMRILEMIVPGGLEELFRSLAALGDELRPRDAARHGAASTAAMSTSSAPCRWWSNTA